MTEPDMRIVHAPGHCQDECFFVGHHIVPAPEPKRTCCESTDAEFHMESCPERNVDEFPRVATNVRVRCEHREDARHPDCPWCVNPVVESLFEGKPPERPLRWDESDLDRCVHGRHSIDSCADCPGGQSTGNLFLLGLARGHHAEMTARLEEGLVRIGTAVRGEPIYVRPVRARTALEGDRCDAEPKQPSERGWKEEGELCPACGCMSSVAQACRHEWHGRLGKFAQAALKDAGKPVKGWQLTFIPEFGLYAGQKINRTFVGGDNKDWALGVMKDRYGPGTVLLEYKALHKES